MPTLLRRALLLAAIAIGGLAVVAFLGPDVSRPPMQLVGDGQRYPEGCEAFDLSRRRCDLIVESLAKRRGVNLEDVTEIRLMGPRRCDDRPRPCPARQGFVVRVVFIRPGERAVSARQTCGPGGIGWTMSPLCTDEPPVQISIPERSGHGDIPCPGEPPHGCATPVPPIDPALAGLGIPLRKPSIAVPLDHVGRYEVPVGLATLPNGILTEASLTLVEDTQVAYLLEDGGIQLEILDPAGELLAFGYAHERREDLQQVQVRLTFEVRSYDPGTVLHFEDLVVR